MVFIFHIVMCLMDTNQIQALGVNLFLLFCFLFPHCTLKLSSTFRSLYEWRKKENRLHVNKYKPCQIHVWNTLRRLWSESERCSYWSTLLWATIGEVLMRRLCRASRHALQFVFLFFFFKKKKVLNGLHIWILLLSYIRTSNEGVQINILYI